MSWTLAARYAEKPHEKGIVAIDLTIDDRPPLTLRFFEAERLEAALSNALAGIDDDTPSRISCANVNDQIVIIVDETSLVALTREYAESMRNELKRLIPNSS